MALFQTFEAEIQRLCQTHKVKTLHAFGSVNTDQFSPDSDVDLVVDFEVDDPIEYSDHYFDLKFELERLFKRPVDLLEVKAIRNSFLRSQIDRNKVLVYG